MSQIITQPMLQCKRCGGWMTVTMARTFNPDPTKEQLHVIMRIVLENGLCPRCEKQRAWYISQGRLEDWNAGRP